MKITGSWDEVKNMSKAAKDNYMKKKNDVDDDVRINISSAGWSVIREVTFLLSK